MARRKKPLSGRKEIYPKRNTSEISTGNTASCSQKSCSHVDLQFSEIKNELKNLRSMVEFAVRLLTKLVPASIDDFQNILNGSTGLTVTTVPSVVTNEADRLEIQAVEDPMETEEDNADMQGAESHDVSPSVIVQIDSCPPSPKEKKLSRTSSRASSCTDETETTAVTSAIMPSPHVSGVENAAKFNSDIKVNSCFESAKTDDDQPILERANLDFSINNVWPTNESDVLPGSENEGTIHMSHISDMPTELHTPAVDPLIETDNMETNSFSHFDVLARELQKQLNSSVDVKTGLKDNTKYIGENESDNSRTMVDTESEKDQINCGSEQFNLDNTMPTLIVPPIDLDTGSNSIFTLPHTEHAETKVVKEELPSEYDDSQQKLQHSNGVKVEPEGEYVSGMIPECVLIKNENEENTGNNRDCDADGTYNENSHQIFSGYSAPASDEFNIYELGREISNSQQVSQNQIQSPLKPLFGSALVSKLKQKIQEKIQAAVGNSNEENHIMENDLINTKSCINLSLAFNDDSENSKQIIVTKNKQRPKFYQCKSCAKIFFCTITLQAHKNNCCGFRKQFRCSSCPLIFKSRTILGKHRRLHARKLARNNRHKCESCGRDFILKSTLKRHRQSQICMGTRIRCYKKLPQYFCIECGEGFLNAGNLALHQKLHAVDKNLTNSTAKNAEVRKQDAPAMQGNRATRRYPCGYCDEAFIDRRSVTLHEKLHTDKEFAAFDQERRLIQRRHQLMMMQKQQQKSSEKKFGCNVCGRTYPIELLLDMHTRLHHAIS